MATFPRGSLVQYRGRLFYYQGNGNQCYLYERAEDVGKPARACHAPGKKQVFLPTEDERAAFKPRPKPPAATTVPPSRVSRLLVLPPSSTRITIPIHSPPPMAAPTPGIFVSTIAAYFSFHPASRAKPLFEALAPLLDAQLDPARLDKVPEMHTWQRPKMRWEKRVITSRELSFTYKGWDFDVHARPWPWSIERYNKGKTDHRYIWDTQSTPEEVAAWIVSRSADDATPADGDLSESDLSDESSRDEDDPDNVERTIADAEVYSRELSRVVDAARAADEAARLQILMQPGATAYAREMSPTNNE